MEQNWYAVYTKPNRELKVSKLLTSKGFEIFCPLNNKLFSKANYKKISAEPLFKTFVFVNIAKKDLHFIQKISDIQLVYWMSEPAIINNDEIDMVRNITANYINIAVEKSAVKTGVSLSIIDALNVGLGEKSLAFSLKNIKVNLPTLGYTITAEKTIEPVEILTLQNNKPSNGFSLFPRRFNSLFTN
jgi:Transcription termination factor nusG